MVDTFQSARCTRLVLALQRHKAKLFDNRSRFRGLGFTVTLPFAARANTKGAT